MKPYLALVAFFWTLPAAAVTPYLVKDINPELVPGSSYPESFAALGDVSLFLADDGEHSLELWRSDGTAAGTYLLADACEGDCPGAPEILLVTAARAFFLARDEEGRTHLWVTDGTRPGTLRLTAELLSANFLYRSLAEAGGIVYLAAGAELWRTDGTPAGTWRVASWPAVAETNPRELTVVGGQVFFHVDDGVSGRALWKSDGTPAGTVEVADVEPAFLRAFRGQLYFWATDAIRGTELWRSDGTPQGTAPVAGLPAPAEVFDAVVHGGLLYFVADTGGEGQELWVTDGSPSGSESGTQALTSFEVAAAFFGDDVHPPRMFFLPRESLDGRFVFRAAGPQGAELWTTDGSPSGTRPLRLLCPAPCEFIGHPALAQPVLVQGRWLFVAFDEARGFEPWVTDGSPSGTRLVRDICAGTCSSGAFVIGRLGDRLMLVAEDILHGLQLWITDGTPRGTTRLTHLPAGRLFPRGFWGGAANGSFLFPVDDPATGTELWVTDGTRAGTRLLADINTLNFGGSAPRSWMPAGDHIYFFANDGRHGNELWTSDGTAAGTRLVADLTPGEASSLDPSGASAFARGKVFFTWAPDGTPLGFWRSDGSAAGTFRLTPEGVEVNPDLAPVAVGKRVYFVAGDEEHGQELWRTDGRVAGTRRVADLRPGALGPSPRELTAFQGRLYFVADGRGLGAELWRTDGTARGTTPVEEAPSRTDPRHLRVHASRLYFFADDGEHGTALWSTDGTAAGTALVADVSPGEAAVAPRFIVSAGSRLFFATREEGREEGTDVLWVSGGTAAGTRRVASFDALGLEAAFVQGRVFFGAVTPEGIGLWMNDGTAEGTRPVLDRDGNRTPFPVSLAAFDGTLLFTDSRPRLWQWTGPREGAHPLLDLIGGTLGQTSRHVFFALPDPEVGLELGAVGPDSPAALRTDV